MTPSRSQRSPRQRVDLRNDIGSAEGGLARFRDAQSREASEDAQEELAKVRDLAERDPAAPRALASGGGADRIERGDDARVVMRGRARTELLLHRGDLFGDRFEVADRGFLLGG